MAKFRVGDRVLHNGYEISGTVDKVFPHCDINDILIVKMDDGNTIKCLSDCVSLIEKKEENRDEITITRTDFGKAIIKITHPDNFKGLSPISYELLIKATIIITERLEKELFGETAKK